MSLVAADATGRAPSFVDRLDARTRILAAIAVIVTAVAITDPSVLAAAVVALAALAAATRVAAADLGRRLLHLEGFMILLVMMLPFSVAGETAFRLGPLAASWAGLDRALLILLRVNVAALALFVLVAGIEPVRLGHALARLSVPPRLVLLLLFAARYVGVLRAEAVRLHEALRARGFVARTSRHTVRTLGHVVGQLLVRTVERAERIDEAMRCRGFSGHFALVTAERFSSRDAVFAAALAAALVVALGVGR